MWSAQFRRHGCEAGERMVHMRAQGRTRRQAVSAYGRQGGLTACVALLRAAKERPQEHTVLKIDGCTPVN